MQLSEVFPWNEWESNLSSSELFIEHQCKFSFTSLNEQHHHLRQFDSDDELFFILRNYCRVVIKIEQTFYVKYLSNLSQSVALLLMGARME